jgi:Xaa-Pro aminopeptidase
MFEASIYTRRRAALVSALHRAGVRDGLALFPGNHESPINYPDNAYRFRQDSSFLYFFGIAEADLAAVLDVGYGTATLYADTPTMHDLIWTGPRPAADDLRKLCGADAVRARSEFTTAVAKAARADAGGATVHFLPPYRMDTKVELAEALGLSVGALGDAASVPLIQAGVSLRELKNTLEVAELEKAVDISVDMHRAVIGAAAPGLTEAALMAEAYRVAYRGGGVPSFQAIATTRGAVLHNHGYDGRLEDGGLFLLDAGAETVEGYSGDLTSTFPVSGRYNEQQKAIYELVLRAGKVGSSMLKPGTAFLDVHIAAARVIAAGLTELGIMKGNADEAVEAGAHACFFPHGLGHQLGLDVHDMEGLGESWVGYDGHARSQQFGLRSLRMGKRLKAGMVMTMEPGIYFIEGLLAEWKAEKRHASFIDYAEAERWADVGGIRNEEDWLITETGAQRLGKPFDKSLASMESYKK